MVMLVILPIYFVMKGDDVGTRLRTFVIRSAALIFANFACLFILFAPKVLHVLANPGAMGSQSLNQSADRTLKKTPNASSRQLDKI